MRSMVEGALASELHRRCRIFVAASAPPTAQERGPPSPLSWGGMNSASLFDKVNQTRARCGIAQRSGSRSNEDAY
jgi:hypothetical protein